MTKKKTSKKASAPTEEKKENMKLCGKCEHWKDTNECTLFKSPCAGGVVNDKALACKYYKAA